MCCRGSRVSCWTHKLSESRGVCENQSLGSIAGAFGGGGVLAITGAIVYMSDCRLTGNSAAFGGGLATYSSSFVQLDASFVGGNRASLRGGGAYVNLGRLVMQHCNVSENAVLFSETPAQNLGWSYCHPTWSVLCGAGFGDCDSDDDCKAGLKCWSFSSPGVPPGVANWPTPDESDVCYNPEHAEAGMGASIYVDR